MRIVASMGRGRFKNKYNSIERPFRESAPTSTFAHLSHTLCRLLSSSFLPQEIVSSSLLFSPDATTAATAAALGAHEAQGHGCQKSKSSPAPTAAVGFSRECEACAATAAPSYETVCSRPAASSAVWPDEAKTYGW